MRNPYEKPRLLSKPTPKEPFLWTNRCQSFLEGALPFPRLDPILGSPYVEMHPDLSHARRPPSAAGGLISAGVGSEDFRKSNVMGDPQLSLFGFWGNQKALTLKATMELLRDPRKKRILYQGPVVRFHVCFWDSRPRLLKLKKPKGRGSDLCFLPSPRVFGAHMYTWMLDSPN